MTNWANYARDAGWQVGTVLEGGPIYLRGVTIESERVIRITAIGRASVLAEQVDDKSPEPGREASWGFDSREWTEREPCECDSCSRASISLKPWPYSIVRVFIVCSACRNKRCPHADWHGYKCTSSNEPGQQGEAA